MATYSIIDVNDLGKVGRGSIGTLSALSTAITWFDLTNPGSVFPFYNRLGTLSTVSASFEGTFSMTFQIVVSLQDTQPATTPAGASGATAWPNIGSFAGTASQIVTVPNSVRWIGLNCSAFTSGAGTGWVSAIFPSR